MGAGEADVDALVEDLRRDADELRERLGPRPPPDPSAAAGTATPGDPYANPDAAAAARARLDRLRALADPRGGPLRSHREAVGGLVLAAKRLLIRLLTPIWDQQTQFDRAAVEAIAELQEAHGRLAREHDDLDRRLRRLEDALARGAAPASVDPAFDYDRFQARFRDAERTREEQRLYLGYFPSPDSGPVLDLGCGEGTFLALLRESSVAAFGVERGKVAVERARAAGLDVREGDLLDALAACGDGSLGGVVAFQVVEHLPLPTVVRLVRLARRKLRPGGCLILETVNLASLIVHARAWTIDPTHRLPLHPLTLRFLVDDAGFRESELVYSGAVEPERRLETSGADPLGARNVEILNEVLFGPQDCAVVARA